MGHPAPHVWGAQGPWRPPSRLGLAASNASSVDSILACAENTPTSKEALVVPRIEGRMRRLAQLCSSSSKPGAAELLGLERSNVVAGSLWPLGAVLAAGTVAVATGRGGLQARRLGGLLHTHARPALAQLASGSGRQAAAGQPSGLVALLCAHPRPAPSNSWQRVYHVTARKGLQGQGAALQGNLRLSLAARGASAQHARPLHWPSLRLQEGAQLAVSAPSARLVSGLSRELHGLSRELHRACLGDVRFWGEFHAVQTRRKGSQNSVA